MKRKVYRDADGIDATVGVANSSLELVSGDRSFSFLGDNLEQTTLLKKRADKEVESR